MTQKRDKVAQQSCTVTSTGKGILRLLMEYPHGLGITILVKLLNKPRRTVYYNLQRLQKDRIVQNIFPIWRLCNIQGGSPKVAPLLARSDIQLHNLSFVIRLIRKPSWWNKRNNRLEKLTDFAVRQVGWGNSNFVQMAKDDFLIQTFSNSIIFMCRKKYLSKDPYDCFIEGMKDFLAMYDYLEQRLKFKFFLDGVPQVSVRSQHYVRLRDAIAERCKKTGKKFEINIDGKLRMWVDLSEPLGVEAGHKNYAPEDMRKYSNRVKDVLIHDLPLPSEQHEQVQTITKKQEMFDYMPKKVDKIIQSLETFAEGMRQHMKLIKALQDVAFAMRDEKKRMKRAKSSRDKSLYEFF